MDIIEQKWLTEPNQDAFQYEGYECFLNRNEMGSWCGYVALKEGDPYYGMHYDDIDIEVHGGLSYGEHAVMVQTRKEHYIIGFDCSHINDFIPNIPEDSAHPDVDSDISDIRMIHELNRRLEKEDTNNPKVYRDIEFARSECRKMVDQILKEKDKTPKD